MTFGTTLAEGESATNATVINKKPTITQLQDMLLLEVSKLNL